jgi:large subunit ribosomal protein L3
MTHMFLVDKRANTATSNQEVFTAVTVLDCPPIVPFSIRSYSSTPYGSKVSGQIFADKLNKDLERKIKVPKKSPSPKELTGDEISVLVHTLPKDALGKKKPEVFECKVGGATFEDKLKYAKEILGKEMKVSDIFAEGDFIDVCAVTRGKGTQGPVKRFGIRIQRPKAQRSGKGRHVGTLGGRGTATRWTVPQAGQMGYNTRTEHNKRVVKVGTKEDEITPKGGFVKYGEISGDFIAIKGSIPGPRKRLIRLRPALRKSPKLEPPETTYTSTLSNQGR